MKNHRPQTQVGTVLGYEYPASVARLIEQETLVPDPANSELLSLKKLLAGRFDIVVANVDDLKSANYPTRHAGVEGQVVPAFMLESDGTYLGFLAAHPQTPAAMQAFELGMVRIQCNGTLQKILARWKATLH